MDLDGQLAIVTGAGQGIGRAVALELASLGADVVVADMNADAAEQTASEVRDAGRNSIAVQTDVRQRAQTDALAERAMYEFGRIDVLVNNAGIHRRMAALDVTDEFWDAMVNVNVKGVLYCCQSVIPYMQQAKRGKIISTASQSGKRSGPLSLVYGLTKAAVISMTRTLALEFAQDGILVNCVCPGSIDTAMWDEIDLNIGQKQMGLQPGEWKARRAAEIPLGRLGTPEDVAKVFGFLASSKADYMTGQAINVTGGLVMY